jgi:opacity protein-like surface antigen
MKKIIAVLSFIGIFLFAQQSVAQVYVRGGAGGAFGVVEDAFNIPSVNRDTNGVVVSQRTIFGSFGSGGRFSIAGGYMITPNFGIELGFYYFAGTNQEFGNNSGNVGNSTQYSRFGRSYQVRALPSLVVTADEGMFRPFARFGVLVPIFGKTIIDESWGYRTGASRAKTTEIDGKFSIGFESSVGVAYHVNDNLSISLDVTYTGLRIRSFKGLVVQDDDISADGTQVTNRLENADVILMQIEFQDVLTRESNIDPSLNVISDFPRAILIDINGDLDFNKPLNIPTQTSNFNALSVNVGLQYTFGKKES